MESSVGKGPYKGPVAFVEIEVGPAVPFRPPDETSLVERRITVLDVSVHPFGNNGLRAVGAYINPAKVESLKVAALADEIESVVVAEPLHAVEIGIGVFSLPFSIQNIHLLVFECQ